MMTPKTWYAQKRAEYRAFSGRDWRHRTDQSDQVYDREAAEITEIAMRSGVECRMLQASGHDEVMMIANGILIQDIISGAHPNSAVHRPHRKR